MKYSHLFLFVFLILAACSAPLETSWPDASPSARPGVRWWWLGNAVDSVGLTANMEDLHNAGIGAVEITPIYGINGAEHRHIEYLSPRWMNMYKHVVDEGKRLDIQIDMNNGTGWPFGGPEIKPEYAATRVIFQKYQVKGGENFSQKIVPDDRRQANISTIATVMAFNGSGNIELTDFVTAEQMLDWTAPEGDDWTVWVVFNGKTRQMVKRAAPGGEGFVMNHYSREVLDFYLKRFDDAYAKSSAPFPARFFNDSYEVYGADWTPDFLTEFEQRRGYLLQDYFHELLANGTTDVSKRVVSDYRETIGNILKDNFTVPWTNWAHSHGVKTKNQAHGSPANLLDLYAAVDIPEGEIFGNSDFNIPFLRTDTFRKKNDGDPTVLKYASSAANITGKKYISCETFTWLTEHFRTSLSQCKPEIDQMFISGINHVYFHGSTYSPKEAAWPGWKFYASIDMTATNPFWKDATAFFDYITRTQSFLQSGKPDNDFLLYFPMYDIWNDRRGNHYLPFAIHGMRDRLPEFVAAVENIMACGYDVDYISDFYIQSTTMEKGLLKTMGGTKYKALILPATHLIPVETMQQIIKLAVQGACIIFVDHYPADVPGLSQLKERRNQFKALSQMLPAVNSFDKTTEHRFGKGKIITGNGTNYAELLEKSGAKKEVFSSELGGQMLRRSHKLGYTYFFTMLTNRPIDQWVPISINAKSALFFDPMTGKSGQASLRQNNGKTEVYMQLKPGQSIILKTFTHKTIRTKSWDYYQATNRQTILSEGWQLSFPKSEPAISETFALKTLSSWTDLNHKDLKRNMGTGRYTIQFDFQKEVGKEYRLDLGDVRESARVKLNGKNVGILYAVPFETLIGSFLKNGENTLEIEVTNLPANRIADYDRQGIEWRIFHEINFVNIAYQTTKFDTWNLVPSGLLGPVTIQELNPLQP